MAFKFEIRCVESLKSTVARWFLAISDLKSSQRGKTRQDLQSGREDPKGLGSALSDTGFVPYALTHHILRPCSRSFRSFSGCLCFTSAVWTPAYIVGSMMRENVLQGS